MAGVKGRSGTNKGKDKPFADALRMEIAEAEDNPRSLRKIARKLLDKAVEGDVPAMKEIADRLDGKPAQAVEMSGGLSISHEEALDELDRPGADDPAQAQG